MSRKTNNMHKIKVIFSSKDLSIFCEQVAAILSSGMLLHEGISMMADETKDEKIRNTLTLVADKLANNVSLKEALKQSCSFPKYLINIAAIGYESGYLEKAMKSLSKYYDRQAAIHNTIKSSVLYPSVLILMMLSVLIFLSAKVLPVFQNVLQSLGSDLPSFTIIIMNTGKFLNSFMLIIIIAVIIIIVASIYFFRYNPVTSRLSRIIWQTSNFQTLSQAIMANLLSATIASGMDINSALELSATGVLSDSIKQKVNICLQLLNESNIPLIEAIEQSKLFTGMAASILKTGMATGTLDKSFDYIAAIYEENFETIIIRRISLIEPVSVAVLSTLIGIILVSVMLPLLGVMSVIGA